MVGARGHSLGYHLLFGSVSVHLAHYAQELLVTVREHADPTSRQIVVGADGSADSAAALRFAFEAAAAHRLPLIALHGWQDPAQERGDETAAALLDEAVAAWAVMYPEVPATAKAVPGGLARAAPSVLRTPRVDLAPRPRGATCTYGVRRAPTGCAVGVTRPVIAASAPTAADCGRHHVRPTITASRTPAPPEAQSPGGTTAPSATSAPDLASNQLRGNPR